MNDRRIPLIVGLVLAVGTGILLMNFLTGMQRPTAAMRPVLVAVADISARSAIKTEMVSVSEREASGLDTDALADPKDVAGKIALITIPAGSIVSSSKIGTAPDLALPVRLSRGLRAVSLAVDRVKSVSGLVEPGDRVDVIAAPPRSGGATPKVATILRGVLVLAVGGVTETASATAAPATTDTTTITLALTPPQANLLVLADINATVRLALRSPEERNRSFPTEPLEFGPVEVAQQSQPAPVVQDREPAPVAVAAAAPPAPVRPKASRWSALSVPILDGDHFVSNTQAAQ